MVILLKGANPACGDTGRGIGHLSAYRRFLRPSHGQEDCLRRFQVAIQLPIHHVNAVIFPLFQLGAAESLVNIWA
jgi:hypothetical protein